MVTKYALPLMKEGKIVNMSSIHGRLGHGRPSAIAYSAFKAALDNYTKNLAKELAPKILVNAIAPGAVMRRCGEAEREGRKRDRCEAFDTEDNPSGGDC